MNADHYREIGRRFLAAVLLAVIVLVSFGSHSDAFHRWIHEDRVECVSHCPSACAPSEEERSDEESGEEPCPLLMFCHGGLLAESGLIEIVFAEFRTKDLYGPKSILLACRSVDASSPPRAPPVLV